jgi:diguanylate cyclase (GGDEF)-like protein
LVGEHKIEERLFGPFTGLTFLAILFILGSFWFWIHEGDAASRAREEHLVANGVRAHTQEIQGLIVPQTSWDEAVRRLDQKYDRAFASDQMGSFFHDTSGFEASYVLNGADRPLFAMEGGRSAPSGRCERLRAGAAPLVRKVREAEIARGPLTPAPNPEAGMISRPIQASSPLKIDNAIYIVTATLVQPDFGTVLPHARAPIVITAEAVDTSYLETVGDRFLLKDLRADPPGIAPDDRAAVELSDVHGNPILVLTWQPQRPGAALFRKAVAPVMALIVTLGVGAALLFLNARKVTQSLIASEARAKHQAMHDCLTGLPNRSLLGERLHMASERLRRSEAAIGVLCLDLDRFKEVNDTLGHHTGDELIRLAARRLGAVCRSTDTVARLGGDEFAIVAIDAEPAGLAALAQRIVDALSGPAELEAGVVNLSCSVGVTLVRDPSVDGAEALRQADLALYRAKEQGRGQYCFFEPEMDAALKHRKALEADLRKAMAANDLRLVYQPQVDGRGRITGVEALIRWTDPERGPIPPSVFVQLAEEAGMIDALGAFALRRAFRDSGLWPALTVAINVSPIQLRNPKFLSMVAVAVEEFRVDPRRFELEITESALLEDAAEVQATLNRLRDMGFSLALDDFGTGYSSLSYLRRYPVDRIKIDRSFVGRVGVDHDADAVVSAIVKLAKALNLGIIAEGVETDEQRRRLRQAGCPHAQGYLFSPPVEVTDVESLLGGRLPVPAGSAGLEAPRLLDHDGVR